MIRQIPFGNVYGFGNNRSIRRLGRKLVIIESYYSQGMRKSLFGIMPSWTTVKQKSSDDIATLGLVKWFANRSGTLYAQDDSGRIYAEATPGALDFGAAVHSPGGTGNGLIVDQKGRLVYANSGTIGYYDGSWHDSWQTLTSADHPMTLYQDQNIIGNGSALAVVFGDDSFNATAFTVPSGMAVKAVCAGLKGVLVGANLGNSGYLILWDSNTLRALSPWLPVQGKVLSICQYRSTWIVVTEKQILQTNGYSVSPLFDFIDDPLSFNTYAVVAGGTLCINDKLVLMQAGSNFARMKPGIYLFDIPSKTFEYCAISTGNTVNSVPGAVTVATNSSSQRNIVIGYQDSFLAKSYIGTLLTTGPTLSTYISEKVGTGPTTKQIEKVVLNFGISTEKTDLQPISFMASVKVFNFDRQLWGYKITTTGSTTSTIVVNGASGTMTAQNGDEVTILHGVNAGLVRHITAIANQGTSAETWTLDRPLPNSTESFVYVNVQPFRLINSITFNNQSKLTDVPFPDKTGTKGKKFLIKVVLEGMNGTQPEMHDPIIEYNDLGITS